MIFFFQVIILLPVVTRTIHFGNALNVKRFVVVSGSTDAYHYYPKIGGPTCFYCAPKIDGATKKKICRDIFSSREFGMFGKHPYKLSAESNISRIFSRHRQEDYASKELALLFSFEGAPETDIFEHAFPCLVNEHGEIKEYFVSREYNINLEADLPDDYIVARFVFTFVDGKPRLDGLVEDAAKTAIFDTREQIEDLYLERREKYLPARSRKGDPLCNLTSGEKLRICVAIFNSSYFDGLLEFPYSSIEEVDGTCDKKTISFRTPDANAKVKAARRTFEEWTMSCKFPEREEKFDYLLSQAYRTNEIFVYFVDPDSQKVFPETVSSNVRLKVDGNRLWDPNKSNVSYDYASDYIRHI